MSAPPSCAGQCSCIACRSTSFRVQKAFRQPAHSQRNSRVVSTFTGGGDGQEMRSGWSAEPAKEGAGALANTGGCDDEAAEGVGVDRPLVMTGAGWLAVGVEDVH